ncbi:MAG: phenylalanine--tRNA ligase subunit alpha [archaeon]
MSESNISDTLTAIERKVLLNILVKTPFKEIMSKTSLLDIEVMRGLQWLTNKGLAALDEDSYDVVELDSNGLAYSKNGLPEKRFMLALADAKPLTLEQLKEKASLDQNEVTVCLGLLRQKGAIDIKKDDKGMHISITFSGKTIAAKDSLEEKFLKGKFPKKVNDLQAEEVYAVNEFKKRKNIIKVSTEKLVYATLTDEGKKIRDTASFNNETVEKLTPLMLKTGDWKGKDFRKFDVAINVPKIHGGKRHFVSQAVNYAKKIWTDMGFKEMEGPILNTSFWNFDALYTAQDHPVRDMQDTFFIKNPLKGKLPYGEALDRVKLAHEKGIAGSSGWQYSWSEEEAKKNVLRTHTTVLSAKTLAALKETDLPAKFFSVGKCFRNETIDWKHHFEFNQTDGIVVDPNANFRHLLGYLRVFFKKMGYPDAKFHPSHFPYTEPSVEIEVFHPIRKEWFEIGGAGVFRPEVVVPLLGKDIPVLAWGPGFDRLLMEYYKIDDLRLMYGNDAAHLREIKMWMK